VRREAAPAMWLLHPRPPFGSGLSTLYREDARIPSADYYADVRLATLIWLKTTYYFR